MELNFDRKSKIWDVIADSYETPEILLEDITATVVKFMTNLVDVRPLDPMSPFAVKAMVEELKKNQLCMIFTEGIIEGGNTRMKIYEGPALMAEKASACILPIQILGAEHAFLTRMKGRSERRFLPQITLKFLPAVDFTPKAGLSFREARRISSNKLYDMLSLIAFESYNLDRTLL